jgi:hypothetical protein
MTLGTKLDERNTRGKQHDLPFILVKFTIVLLSDVTQKIN